MQPSDICTLNTHLQRYYGQSYAGIPAAMLDLWYERMKAFPAAYIVPAIKRWATGHLPKHVPAIDDLVGLMEELAREERTANYRGPALQWDETVLDPENRLERERLRAMIEQAVPGTFPTTYEQSDAERFQRREHLRAQLDVLLEEHDAVGQPWGLDGEER